MKSVKVTQYQTKDGQIHHNKYDAAVHEAKESIRELRLDPEHGVQGEDFIEEVFVNLRALAKIYDEFNRVTGSSRPKKPRTPRQPEDDRTSSQTNPVEQP